MTVNYLVHTKANNLLKETNVIKKKIRACLHAAICPHCGESLEIEEKRIFFIKRYKIVCPNNHSLLFECLGDKSDPCSEEYGGCLNYKMRTLFYKLKPEDHTA